MFEYVVTFNSPMGQILARAGFTSESMARDWANSIADTVQWANRWQVWRNGELIDSVKIA